MPSKSFRDVVGIVDQQDQIVAHIVVVFDNAVIESIQEGIILPGGCLAALAGIREGRLLPQQPAETPG